MDRLATAVPTLIKPTYSIGPLAKAIEDATSAQWTEEIDWAAVMTICDAVTALRSDHARAEVVDCVRRLLRSHSVASLSLTVTVLESLSKNCGMPFLRVMGHSHEMMAQLASVAKSTSQRRSQAEILLHSRVLDLIQSWGEQFLTLKTSEPALAGFVALYHDLKRQHYTFGVQLDEHRPPVLTPPPFIPAERVAATIPGLPREVEDGVALLTDALAEAGGDAGKMRRDVVAAEAAENLRAALPTLTVRIEVALSSGSGDIEGLLAVNDQVTVLLAKYEDVIQGRGAPAAAPASGIAAVAPTPTAAATAQASSPQPLETDLMSFLSSGTGTTGVPPALPKPAAAQPAASKTPFLRPPRSYEAPPPGQAAQHTYQQQPPTQARPVANAPPDKALHGAGVNGGGGGSSARGSLAARQGAVTNGGGGTAGGNDLFDFFGSAEPSGATPQRHPEARVPVLPAPSSVGATPPKQLPLPPAHAVSEKKASTATTGASALDDLFGSTTTTSGATKGFGPTSSTNPVTTSSFEDFLGPRASVAAAPSAVRPSVVAAPSLDDFFGSTPAKAGAASHAATAVPATGGVGLDLFAAESSHGMPERGAAVQQSGQAPLAASSRPKLLPPPRAYAPGGPAAGAKAAFSENPFATGAK